MPCNRKHEPTSAPDNIAHIEMQATFEFNWAFLFVKQSLTFPLSVTLLTVRANQIELTFISKEQTCQLYSVQIIARSFAVLNLTFDEEFGGRKESSILGSRKSRHDNVGWDTIMPNSSVASLATLAAVSKCSTMTILWMNQFYRRIVLRAPPSCFNWLKWARIIIIFWSFRNYDLRYINFKKAEM